MNTAVLCIGGRQLSSSRPCLIMAEVTQAHNGSLGMAHAFIDVIGDAGADVVKFRLTSLGPTIPLGEPSRLPA